MATVIRGFLAADEIEQLRALGDVTDGWTPGRQGTGYEILWLKPALLASPILARAFAALGTPFEDFWDVYLIRYSDGAHVPPHVDGAQHGKRHRRINAMLAAPASGGELTIGGARIDLEIGDAVVFFPDEELHEVAPVIGIRLVFSVGAWL